MVRKKQRAKRLSEQERLNFQHLCHYFKLAFNLQPYVFHFQITAWRFYEKCASAPEVEALACIKGLRWAHHWGFTQLGLETDCARIKSALTSSASDRSEVGPIIEEARGWMRLMREYSISLSHCQNS